MNRRDFLKAIGSKGGQATVAKYGREHMRKIGKKGFETTTNRHFRNREDHIRFLVTYGAFNYAQSTGLGMKRDKWGNPIWPENPPTHPAHSNHVEF